jgi:hypothetical protein
LQSHLFAISSSSESDSEVLLVFVSGLTDGQSCQAIHFFLRGVYINVGEIINSDWLKSYIYFPYTPTQPGKEMYLYAPIARVISIEIMLSILIFNKMINFQFD